MITKPPVFLREATGLRKNASLFDAIALNISNMSAGVALASIGYTTILLPTMSGVNLIYGSLIAFALSIPQIIVYTMLSTRIPRTGGDYVWLSRLTPGWYGSIMTFAGWTMGNMPYFSLVAISTVFAIGSVGSLLGYASLTPLSIPSNSAGSAPVLQFIIGFVIITVFVAINVFKPKAGFKFVSVLTIMGAFGIVLAILSLVIGGQTGVINYMNSLHASGANETYTSLANSYSGPTFDLHNTLFALPFFAVFIYPYLNAGPAVSSELKNERTRRFNVAIGACAIFAFVTLSFGAMYYAGGYNFVTAALSNSDMVYTYSFNFWTMAIGASSSVVLQWVIGIFWVAWDFAIIAYLAIVMSRYLMAQAFDRFLPSAIAYVSDRGSPVYALLVEYAIGVAMMAGVIAFYGTLVALYGTAALGMLFFASVGVAAALYGYRKEKGRTKAIMIIAGTVTAIVFLFYDYMFVAYASIWGGNILAYGYNAGAVIFGIIIYILSKRYHAKRGLDISLVFKEIPPE